jgi:hypothetical protein
MARQTLARLYYRVRRTIVFAERVGWSLFTGVSLGVFGRRTLNDIDDLYYVGGEGTKHGPIDYLGDRYNRIGFWTWEKAAIERYFGASGHVAVLAAGGGREVLALARHGFRVDGWECQPQFVSTANRILAAEGFEPTVEEVPRDTCPAGDKRYTGAIVGWGAYTLIQGRGRRVTLLRGLRARLLDGAPVLLSFFPRQETERRFRAVAAIANVGRRLTLRELAEVGDFLEPNFVHYFTEAELRSELLDAGFALDLFEARPYGHAVAIASGPKEA